MKNEYMILSVDLILVYKGVECVRKKKEEKNKGLVDTSRFFLVREKKTKKNIVEKKKQFPFLFLRPTSKMVSKCVVF